MNDGFAHLGAATWALDPVLHLLAWLHRSTLLDLPVVAAGRATGRNREQQPGPSDKGYHGGRKAADEANGKLVLRLRIVSGNEDQPRDPAHDAQQDPGQIDKVANCPIAFGNGLLCAGS